MQRMVHTTTMHIKGCKVFKEYTEQKKIKQRESDASKYFLITELHLKY